MARLSFSWDLGSKRGKKGCGSWLGEGSEVLDQQQDKPISDNFSLENRALPRTTKYSRNRTYHKPPRLSTSLLLDGI